MGIALDKLQKAGLPPGTSIQPQLFEATFKELSNAVGEGWGQIRYNKPDLEFVRQLLKSGQFFAARKTILQTTQLLGILVDPERGTVRSKSEFKKLAKGIVGNYNATWLETERATAVKAARSARLWVKFEEEKDLYPNIEYLRTSSPNPREEHLKWVGIILPMNHPWWRTHMPPVDWGCLCGTKNTDEKPNRIFTEEELEGFDIEPIFRNNPGMSRELFDVKATKYAQKTDFIKDTTIERELKTRVLPEMNFHIPAYTFKNGGSMALHPGVHEGVLDLHIRLGAVLAREGYQVKLQPKYFDGRKSFDLLLNDQSADFKTIESGNLATAIGNRLKAANAQGISTVVLYLKTEADLAKVRSIIKGRLIRKGKEQKTGLKDFVIITQGFSVNAFTRSEILK